ncbi:hypothetical protein Y1Q_0013446 [Alligator mississippiensis]|uniref:Uncharacterized protein n=1 Tax=Alligator mississippiensis TaxID=8496 RepID=A0A151MSB6_ALLMI|nr:hypothetical protein Y1Q_0013446 [Alligator mississippiensis]
MLAAFTNSSTRHVTLTVTQQALLTYVSVIRGVSSPMNPAFCPACMVQLQQEGWKAETPAPHSYFAHPR